MSKWKHAVALTLTAVIAASSLSLSAMADGEGLSTEGDAGIEFEAGGTTIDPGPDTDLGIKNGDIYFGIQDLNPETITYNSIDIPDEEEQRKHAGYVVRAGNADGWTVTAEISDFALNGQPTMKNYILKLIPGQEKTTVGNAGTPPQAKTVELTGPSSDLDGIGSSEEIFVAAQGAGLGKWGCNWEGKLTVVGGSVTEAGNASATILWALSLGQVQP